MTRLIIDAGSILWNSLLAGKDTEFGIKVTLDDGKVKLVNSASYGYGNALNHINKVMESLSITPRQIIFVPDGLNSKQDRMVIHPGYKQGRSKVKEEYEQFNIAKEQLFEAFLNVGAQVCWVDGGVEADDVIGYLTQHLDGEIWIDSFDKDLAVLVGGRVHHYRNGVIDANPFGDFPHRLITTAIAMVGDPSDKIPGAKGFADTSFQYFMLAFGVDGLELMEGLIQNKQLARLEEDVDRLKELKRIMESADSVYMSYELARLRIERVNTMQRPLKWRVGMVKPREQCKDVTLRRHAGVDRIVSAENYAEAMEWAKKQINLSPEVALDVETSTPPESDAWMESREKEDRLDVFGMTLTSLQMTFGPNMQYTFYLPVDNVQEQNCTNLSIAQVAAFVDLVPRHKKMLIQNVAFELPICYMSWGQLWSDDPEYHGFLRNVRDTRIMSSYVDENLPNGLKENSKLLIGYDQVSYEQVTRREETRENWDGVGKVIQSYMEPILVETGELEEVFTGEVNQSLEPITAVIPKHKHVGDLEKLIIERKMNQLRAAEVFDYGCDDTICTAALGNHYRCVMEIENTWKVFEEVETYPAYLTALAFVQGCEFSLQSMAEQEKEDDAAYAVAEPILHDYLMKIGFEGTRYEPLTELDPAGIKRAFHVIHGAELLGEDGEPARVRTLSKLQKLIEMQEPGSVLVGLLTDNDLFFINNMMEAQFTGKPQLDLDSPTQMKKLLYRDMNIPVRVINDVTPIERQKMPDLEVAVKKFKKIRAGSSSGTMTPEELELLKKKAKADDTAIDMSLAFDAELLGEDARAALRAIGAMKKVMTRRKLYYKNYWRGLHWKDGKLHCSVNQCAADTRRYSMSDQNLQQLPKKGEGVKFRRNFPPHKKNAIVCSIDFVGQELRVSAEVSQDTNLLACYVGKNLKDPHSLTAAGALKLAWGSKFVDELFDQYGVDLKRDNAGTYELFMRLRKMDKKAGIGKKADDHRKEAKNVNFAAQNGARAVKVSETLIMTVENAQIFLDGRAAMFPDVDAAAEKSSLKAQRLGYATTLMGARRHLATAMQSEERGASDRAGRQAWSMEIQGSAAEMTKLAMGRMWTTGIYFKYDARFIAPIHDECVSSVTVEHAIDFIREKHWCMSQPYAGMKVPVLGSISIGPNLADQEECGDEFIEENIRKALNVIFKEQEAA